MAVLEAPKNVDYISLASKLVANYVETNHEPRSSFVAEFINVADLATTASSSGEPKTLAMALEWLLSGELPQFF